MPQPCFELSGVSWQKSSRSANNCACVEVAVLPSGEVGVRDSKNQDGPVLVFTPAEWDAFINGVKAGEFDTEQLATNAQAPSLPL
ncbi:DUF397 domain-containing protein [Microbispora sp. ATCC PTA-5024]|uniref:DUF397 domain-containing protein n=1 Tax=Microbispora sp. ATCC PTA-5024 TaxID=316330 RepID=UPI0003DD5D40|nr:DUF397 domain-containing protein [Microbispora sp. ATCC PTA-5024]ETK34575.1 hypothetical protein MPTA5024_18795 [Microbispora sp. ATCC PTA-5024]